jgi:hypothetical protein
VSRVLRRPTAGEAGVFQAEAPDGYVALVVRNSKGRRLLRIEVANDVYSNAWIAWLERWLRKWDRNWLQLIR